MNKQSLTTEVSKRTSNEAANSFNKRSESHLQLSPLIAGYWRLRSWNFSTEELIRFIEQHLALGITTVDHAWIYQSEQLFGRALKQVSELRQQLQIISKCGIKPPGKSSLHARDTPHYDSRGKTIIDSCEQSLSDLNTDHLDILLLHRPDYLMPADEIAAAFDQLKRDGKVKHFGVSNFSRDQFEWLQSVVDVPLVTNQIEYSPWQLNALDSGVFEQCQQHNISVMAWSCLGGGELFNGSNEKSQRLLIALNEVAEAIGAESIDQVVYAWILRHPCSIYPLLGSGKISRYANATKALQLQLSHEQWYRILQASVGHSVA